MGRNFSSIWGGTSLVYGEELLKYMGRNFSSIWGGTSLVYGEELL